MLSQSSTRQIPADADTTSLGALGEVQAAHALNRHSRARRPSWSSNFRRGLLARPPLMIGLLAAAGYILNVFNLPLFSGVVPLLFGSIAALIALELFGIGAGCFVAVVASSYIYLLWHYPYAIVIFALEPLCVGLLRRRTDNLVFADAAFWFLVGMPLSWLIYKYILPLSHGEMLFVTFKYGVNGLLTALISSFILLCAPLRRFAARRRNSLRGLELHMGPHHPDRRESEPSFALLLFNLLVGAAIIPVLGLTLRHSWMETNTAERLARTSARAAADERADTLRNWAADKSVVLGALAHSVSTDSPDQVRHAAVLLQEAHPDFAGFLLMQNGTNDSPQILLGGDTPVFQSDVSGGQIPLLNRSLARSDELRHIAGQLPATRLPSHAFEVHDMGGSPIVVWALAVPVPNGHKTGAQQRIVGLLRLDGLQASLGDLHESSDLRAIILDTGGRVLGAAPAETAARGELFTGLSEEQGRIKQFGDGTGQWWPTHPARPPLVAWANSIFFAQREGDAQAPWRVLVEVPFRGQEQQLIRGFTLNLALILGLALGTMPIATLLARRLNRPLERLASLSTDLPRKLAEHDTSPPVWPRATMSEVAHLVRNVREMEGALRANFSELEHARLEAVMLQRDAEEANRLKDEFLAVLSHELRTPLVPIIGYADLLQMSLGTDRMEEIVREAARVIERNARVQGALIEDLLDVSRIVAGKLTLKIGSVDLPALLADAVETVSFNARARDIEVRLETCETLPKIIGDPARLRQAVLNLLNNAVKFSPDGGKVEIRLERHQDRARIIITDAGRGIDPEFLPLIFDRFRQATHDHQTREAGGLGLGLAIVKHLIELHGGSVEARSAGAGQGSQFIIELPFNFASASGLSPALSVTGSDSAASLPTPNEQKGEGEANERLSPA